MPFTTWLCEMVGPLPMPSMFVHRGMLMIWGHCDSLEPLFCKCGPRRRQQRFVSVISASTCIPHRKCWSNAVHRLHTSCHVSHRHFYASLTASLSTGLVSLLAHDAPCKVCSCGCIGLPAQEATHLDLGMFSVLTASGGSQSLLSRQELGLNGRVWGPCGPILCCMHHSAASSIPCSSLMPCLHVNL